MNTIKVALADDHQMITDGLMGFLEQESDIQIVGIASNGEEILKLLSKEEVDIVVLDIGMPKMSGVEATEEIRKRFPSVKILILSMYKSAGTIKELKKKGVSGYLMKNMGKGELVEAIHTLHNGNEYWSPEVMEAVFLNVGQEKTVPVDKLTKREKEVLALIGEGHTVPEIAEKLFRANTTIESHKRNLMEKLQLKNSYQLVRYAVENGYVNPKKEPFL